MNEGSLKIGKCPKNVAKDRNSSNKLSRPSHQNILHAFIHFSFGL